MVLGFSIICSFSILLLQMTHLASYILPTHSGYCFPTFLQSSPHLKVLPLQTLLSHPCWSSRDKISNTFQGLWDQRDRFTSVPKFARLTPIQVHQNIHLSSTLHMLAYWMDKKAFQTHKKYLLSIIHHRIPHHDKTSSPCHFSFH